MNTALLKTLRIVINLQKSAGVHMGSIIEHCTMPDGMVVLNFKLINDELDRDMIEIHRERMYKLSAACAQYLEDTLDVTYIRFIYHTRSGSDHTRDDVVPRLSDVRTGLYTLAQVKQMIALDEQR